MNELRERYLNDHDGNKVDAATAMARDLMRGDPEEFKAGYTAENAVLAVRDVFGISDWEAYALLSALGGVAFPLHAEMPNGSTLRDWLGTAACAARVGASYIEDVRNNTHADPIGRLAHAEQQLTQALEELRTVKSAAAHLRAYFRPTRADLAQHVQLAVTDVPLDFPVQPIDADDPTAIRPATCGVCGLTWDDGKVTSMTPAPSARCPFEAFHPEDVPARVSVVVIDDTGTHSGVLTSDEHGDLIEVEPDEAELAARAEQLRSELRRMREYPYAGDPGAADRADQELAEVEQQLALLAEVEKAPSMGSPEPRDEDRLVDAAYSVVLTVKEDEVPSTDVIADTLALQLIAVSSKDAVYVVAGVTVPSELELP